MRKVTLKITASIKVPMILTYRATVNVDDGIDISTVARQIVSGKIGSSVTVEDSFIESIAVEDDSTDGDLIEQVDSYVLEDEDSHPRFLDYEVVDSR